MFECPPDVDILRRFYEKERGENQVQSLFDGFEKLNEKLTEDLDRLHTIGHTLFMATEMTPRRLQKIWARKIGPLIEEYFFDQPDLATEYKVEVFWPELE